MSDVTRQEAIAVAALRRLGRAPAAASLAVRLLAGGLSGSSVYQLDLAGEDVVLKVTPPSEVQGLMERARREAWFYRDLALRVPVMVPRVLGRDLNETDGVVVLLAAYSASLPPDQWTEHDYVQVARQVGQLHATFWEKTAGSAMPEWLRAKPPVSHAQCQAATEVWRTLGERDDLRDAWEPFGQRLERLLVEITALDREMTSLPATLCHGDFHADNLLHGPAGEWIWADWQEVRLGPGVDDLTFFWQRAFVAAETPPPYDAMVEAYSAGLETAGGVLMPRKQRDRALAWAELRSWLVDWPGYLEALSAARMEPVLRRIGTLIDELERVGQNGRLRDNRRPAR